MLTGRPAQTPAGLPATTPHGITSDAPGATDTVHNSGSNSGVYKASIFDVVHDRGFSTALYMGKNRLQICERSWNATNGAPDTIGADNGQDKIDAANIVEAMGSTTATPGILAEVVTAINSTTLRTFTFFHVADTDYAGHSSSWSNTIGGNYRNTMKTADGWIGQILDALQNNASLAGKVAVMLTADHGGGGGVPNSHTDATRIENYTIPFFLYAPGFAAGSDLYAYFENRYNPGTGRPTYVDPLQPVRNGDVANLSAALLGLPSVPGSLMVPELKKPLDPGNSTSGMTLNWPGYLTGWTLEFSDDLATWQPVAEGITENSVQFVYPVSLPAGLRFFRLHQPADL
jgi:Type I phosphodiesterase / nucleotide pyrophosphatase